MSGKDKWVRRFSVDETARHKNGFTIYKITSVLFPIESPEAVSVVAVWKRYSDVQRLLRAVLALHAGLHLRGPRCRPMPKTSYFRRFQKEVIEERAKAIKRVLEFIAEHRLLFTSMEFDHFMQSGYPAPLPLPSRGGGVIDAIRSALHLPIEDTPPLEYQTDDDDRTPHHTPTAATTQPQPSTDETDFTAIPQIPIYEAANVERPPLSPAMSLESVEDLNDALYDEISKITIEKRSAVKKKQTLPDLIIFDEPSCSNFEDYHNMPRTSDATSLTSTSETRSSSRLSVYSKQSASLSNVESKTRTEDSYIFEAGYLLNLAARCEDARDYQRAFECYKSGIEKMLIGVQSDTDPQRRALIKEKTNKYLAYAEDIYKNHLCNDEETLIPPRPSRLHCPVPLSMLRRPYEDLALYRVLAVLADTMMLVLHKGEQACYAMKVVQKIPNNLTEFDEYFLQRTNETRQLVLPTSIPYMVPLHSYIETNSLIFLILTYAPGEKLIDYIKNYVKSAPQTPARELNLENVFCEPLKKDNSEVECDIKVNVESESEQSVDEIVKNSQRLLENVDKVLHEKGEVEEVKIEVEGEAEDVRAVESPSRFRVKRGLSRGVLPPSALRAWAAQLLTAIDSLHHAGLVCRDLNPSNILLSDGGQVILTYFVGRPPAACLSQLARCAARQAPDLYAAPELYQALCAGHEDRDPPSPAGETCDYWSFGAIMYELICGFPLSYYHKSVFTSHTVLVLPEDLSVEVESLLTQLLTYDPAERLGRGGVDEIKNHPYFKQIDWAAVLDAWIVPG
ncbi:ribosomal protein S6 kinase-like 1 isoform X3 [Choristoneura fumiferana]|uniref:ribosomal protein S6 kinase-like 1 isoform X3 n=1 Tax=Choristoneura fumiferana TaxID=7141 RepID=UPI003D15C475